MDQSRLITVMGSVIGFLLITAVSMIAWIGVQVWDMNPKVTETARRVDRIVDVLPEVKVRIAEEDIAKSISVVFLTTELKQRPDGVWTTTVHDIDFSVGKQSTLIVRLKDKDDPMVSILVRGVATSVARDRISFADYSVLAASLGENTPVPSFVDGSSSFAITRAVRDPNARIRTWTSVLGQPVRQTSIKKRGSKVGRAC